MRADLLRLGRGVPELEALNLDVRHLFASWFNRGFLVLRAVNWQSPAHLLEKIIAYEAVHIIDSWDDLRRRVRPMDRRCFAVLYSISNCRPGLAGITFGNSLIKQVASDLSAELPNLDTFVTLSPMPRFHKWLSKHDSSQADQPPDNLPALAAYYLLNAKDTKQRPLDPVARFHSSNGAEVHAVHANADLSQKGLSQSGGVMVNYLYIFPRLAQNQERFEQSAEVVASHAVRQRAETVTLPDLQSG